METQGRREGKHQIVVRMPVSLHAKLENWAGERGLSVNAAVCELVAGHVAQDKEAA